MVSNDAVGRMDYLGLLDDGWIEIYQISHWLDESFWGDEFGWVKWYITAGCSDDGEVQYGKSWTHKWGHKDKFVNIDIERNVIRKSEHEVFVGVIGSSEEIDWDTVAINSFIGGLTGGVGVAAIVVSGGAATPLVTAVLVGGGTATGYIPSYLLARTEDSFGLDVRYRIKCTCDDETGVWSAEVSTTKWQADDGKETKWEKHSYDSKGAEWWGRHRDTNHLGW